MFPDTSLDTDFVPPCLEPHRVSDQALARAYSGLGDTGRAFLKQAIARLYALHRPNGPTRSSTTEAFDGALVRTLEVRPRQWFVLLLGPEADSASLLLAALMPAVARRVPRILVLRHRSRRPWPLAQLAALELCGVENVFAPSKTAFKQFLETFLCAQQACETGDSGDSGRSVGPCSRGAVACLGGQEFWRQVRAQAEGLGYERTHWFDTAVRLGIWAGSEARWNLEALRLAHPSAAILAFGGVLEGCESRPGGIESMRRAGLDAALLAPGQCAGALPTFELPCAPLVLTPGMEAFWNFVDAPLGLYEMRTETCSPDRG